MDTGSTKDPGAKKDGVQIGKPVEGGLLRKPDVSVGERSPSKRASF